jgi:hypothetical protein
MVFLILLFAYIYFKPRGLHPQTVAAAKVSRALPPAQAAAVAAKRSTFRASLTQPTLALFEVLTLGLVVTLFGFYLVLTVATLAGGDLVDVSGACFAAGFLTQFFYLSAMCWLSVMNYSVWRGLRQMKMIAGAGGGRRKGWRHRRFKWYTAFALLCPLAVVLATVTAQFLPTDSVPPALRPDVGNVNCLLSERAKIVFLMAPVTPLYLVNLIFFLLSVWNLFYGVWSSNGGRKDSVAGNVQLSRNQLKERCGTDIINIDGLTFMMELFQNFFPKFHFNCLYFFFRLFVVVKMFLSMGIPWFGELISWAIQQAHGGLKYQ